MEIIGVVTELKAETTINGTQARPIVVKEIGCGRVMNILVWINDNTWNIATGDDVVFTPKVYKNKKGQECYSVSLAQILKPKPPEEVKEEEQQAVWTDKDRRMARMNALAHGCRSVQMMLDEKKYAFRDALKEMPETESTSYKPLAESTISGLIMIAADLFLDYIYQDAPYKVAEDVEVDYSDAQA